MIQRGATWRRLRRGMQDLRGYLSFDRSGNEVIRRTDFHACPRPVLLLYGLLSTRRSCEVLERRLRRDGYGVFSINLGGWLGTFNTRSIDRSAEWVAEKVERLYARFDLGPLSIIGHSKGGLIGRYYVTRLGGDRRVRALVTLGTPHQGTPRAYLACATLGMFAPSVWQMTPRSSFIRQLNLGPLPPAVQLTSVFSRQDRCTPFPFGVLDVRRPGDFANVEMTGVTHRQFLTARSVYTVIRSELARAEGRTAIPEWLATLASG